MALQQTATTSFKIEVLQAVHNFGPASPDTFKIALYTGNADIGPDTTVYTTADEVSGAGYTAGGEVLTISQAPVAAQNLQQVPTAYISFAPAVWPAAGFTARGALIYNSTKGDKAVAVLDFGADKTSAGQPFTVTFPTATANDAVVRIS
jgi:hypothetical protein